MEKEPVQISHDGFARFCVLRKIEPGNGCDWCGSARHHNGHELDTLFVYGTQSDGYGAQIEWMRGHFCSLNCFRVFNS